MYKTIVTGINTFSPEWLVTIKNLHKENIIICDFKQNGALINTLTNCNVDYILPLSNIDYLQIVETNTNGVDILYPTVETVDLLHNKALFTKFMLENFNEYIPTVYYLNNVQLLDIEYPVIYKCKYSQNGYGMKIYHNAVDFLQCTDKSIVQKYIDCQYEYGAYMLCINGKIINWKIIKFKYAKYTIKTAVFPPNYENVDTFDMRSFELIVMKLNYSGGINFDFKFDDATNHIYIFEINPRFGGSAFSNNFIYELLCIK
jgi:carbamoylphosphate synthase large subunit